MGEIWKQIVGYEGCYEISSLGSVKSMERVVINGVRNKSIKSRILKQWATPTGYIYVTLSKNGVRKNEIVHILAATAFIDNPDKKPQVNHIDGVKSNNRICNLEWNTAKENCDHKINVLKKHNKGDSHPSSKLNSLEVESIRKMYTDGVRQSIISEKYSIAKNHVSDIVNYRKWK